MSFVWKFEWVHTEKIMVSEIYTLTFTIQMRQNTIGHWLPYSIQHKPFVRGGKVCVESVCVPGLVALKILLP